MGTSRAHTACPCGDCRAGMDALRRELAAALDRNKALTSEVEHLRYRDEMYRERQAIERMEGCGQCYGCLSHSGGACGLITEARERLRYRETTSQEKQKQDAAEKVAAAEAALRQATAAQETVTRRFGRQA